MLEVDFVCAHRGGDAEHSPVVVSAEIAQQPSN